MGPGDIFFLDNFAVRQWDDPTYSGTRVRGDKANFVKQVPTLLLGAIFCLCTLNEPWQQNIKAAVLQPMRGTHTVRKQKPDPNTETDQETTAGPRTSRSWLTIGGRICTILYSNSALVPGAGMIYDVALRALISRWFPADKVTVGKAKYLDIILYSREQLKNEAQAKGGTEEPHLPNVPWGIISIKAQDEDFETPMQPFTMMRNALGREEGGSGVPLDREAYQASVNFWKQHAVVAHGANAG